PIDAAMIQPTLKSSFTMILIVDGTSQTQIRRPVRPRRTNAISSRITVREGPRPRRSTALADMLSASFGDGMFLGVLADQRLDELEDGLGAEAGLGGFAHTLAE